MLDVVLAVKAVVVVVVVVVVSYVRAKGEQYVGIFVVFFRCLKTNHMGMKQFLADSTNGAASRQSESRASGVGSRHSARTVFTHLTRPI